MLTPHAILVCTFAFAQQLKAPLLAERAERDAYARPFHSTERTNNIFRLSERNGILLHTLNQFQRQARHLGEASASSKCAPQRHRHRNRRRALCVLHFSGVLLPLHPKRRRNFIAPIAVDVASAIVAAAAAAAAVVAAVTFSLAAQRHIHFRHFHLVTIRHRYACR